MHKLMEYVCEELEELERKAAKEGKLSMNDLQVADTLAHLKKNLLKAEEMSEQSEYSMMGGYSRRGSYAGGGSYRGDSYAGGGSYADNENYPNMDFVRPDGSYRDGGMSGARGRGRGARRDAMGRYSSEGGVDEHTKEELMKLIEKM